MKLGSLAPASLNSSLKALVLTFGVLMGLSGCGSSFHPIENSDDTTGATTRDGRDYTTSSNDSELQEIKASIDPNKGQNKVLALGIVDARINRIVDAKSISLEVGLVLSNSVVMKFEVPLTRSGGELKAENIPSTNVGAHWKLSARCLDLACDSITLRLKKEVDGELEAEAGLIYRLRQARVEVFMDPSIPKPHPHDSKMQLAHFRKLRAKRKQFLSRQLRSRGVLRALRLSQMPFA